MKIALLQMQVQSGDLSENQCTAERLIRSAAAQAEVLVLPELWLCGYSLRRVQTFAEGAGGATLNLLKQLAQEYKVHLITGSLPYAEQGLVFNRVFYINPQGEIRADYSKIHLFSLFQEDQFFAPGPKLTTFQLGDWTAGLAICYDLRFPELFRSLALAGAQIIFVPAEWPTARGDHWLTLAQARAIENQVYLCAVNCVGTHKEQPFFGHSMLIGPDGQILAQGGVTEEIIYGKIEIDEVQKVRQSMTVFADRRKELYQL